jgi:murein DD-endopeptidase MepM/ murein hydrolase activator NlpD
MPIRVWTALVLLALGGCGSGPTSPSPVSTACTPTASSARAASPAFYRPFQGEFPTGNLFDHDKPIPFGDGNNYVVSMCGARVPDQPQVNGHNGYDWRMAEGTTLLAVADGLVMYAGLEEPFNCPPLGRAVQAIYVQLRHPGPDGTEYITVYGHLSRLGVATGDTIAAGAIVGWSGNTGCSGTPHLHFGTFRGRDGNFVAIDPYGWHASTPDPWESDPRGDASVWLWRDGEAPGLR